MKQKNFFLITALICLSVIIGTIRAQETVRVNLLGTSGVIVNGALNVYGTPSPVFNYAVNEYDAQSAYNPALCAFYAQGVDLSIQALPFIGTSASKDTVQIRTSQLGETVSQSGGSKDTLLTLSIECNVAPHATLGSVYDTYLGTSTPLSLSGVTTYPFTVSRLDPLGSGSRAQFRFRLVFCNGCSSLRPAFAFTGITTTRRPATLRWTTNDVADSVSYFEIQHMREGRFVRIPNGTISRTERQFALPLSAEEETYRIAARIGTSYVYSQPIREKAQQPVSSGEIQVYPNPTPTGVVTIVIATEDVGHSIISLMRNDGTVVLKPQRWNTLSKQCSLPRGIYLLSVVRTTSTLQKQIISF